MTRPNQPIATTYVEIRPSRDAKTAFKREVEDAVEPAARATTGRIGKALSDGLKTPVGSTAAGAAIGTALGSGIATGLRTTMRGLTAIPRTGFAELKDYQAGLAQLQAGLRSTGGVAGLTARELEDLASSIQRYSGQTDDSIVRAEGFLLTFDQVRNSVGKGNDVFTRATQASADLAARGFGSAESSAVQLGKALQDPTRGLLGLTRVGVTFTAQQRAQIKGLQEAGRLLDAQKVILAAVEKQVGGSARAYGQTLPGSIDRAKRSFEDISQTVVGSTFTFVDNNRKTTAAVAGLVGGIYIAHKAVLAYRALNDTLLGGAARKVAANAAVARSYDGVAASATRAAEAEAVAAGGGVPGLGSKNLGRRAASTAGRFGVYGALAAGTAAAGYELLKTGFQVTDGRAGSTGAGYDLGADPDFFNSRPGEMNAQGVRPSATNVALALMQARQADAAARLAQARMTFASPEQRAAEAGALGGVFGGSFSTLAPRRGDVAGAREAQRRANLEVEAAERAVRDARAGGGGATAAQIASAEASVASRQAALRKRGGDPTSERLALEAAEARLADLRGRGGVNTDKLRAAEEKLRRARQTATEAAKDTRKAEEGTALGVKAVTDRLGGQLKNAKNLRDDAKVLIADGVSRGVLEELYKLEQDAPGTLDKVAKSLTPAMAKQLNSQHAALQKVQSEFLTAPLRAAVEQAKAEQDKILAEAAAQQAALYAKALADAGVVLTPKGAPTPTGPGGRPEAPDTSAPVVLQIQGYGARQVRQVAATELARADRQAALSVGLIG